MMLYLPQNFPMWCIPLAACAPGVLDELRAGTAAQQAVSDAVQAAVKAGRVMPVRVIGWAVGGSVGAPIGAVPDPSGQPWPVTTIGALDPCTVPFGYHDRRAEAVAELAEAVRGWRLDAATAYRTPAPYPYPYPYR